MSDDHHHKYYLSVLAIFKNERLNLKTWIDHYVWQGVDHIYLIDNDSDDHPLEILQEYIDKGVVSYYLRKEPRVQVKHYVDIFEHEKLKEETYWLCICDLDEFFFGTTTTLKNTLRDLDAKTNVILSNWHNYGHDGNIEHPKDIRVGNLNRDPQLQNTKTIFKTQVIDHDGMINIHHLHNYHGPSHTENDLIRLHHYRLQSEEYFVNNKMTRGDVLYSDNHRDMSYFHDENAPCTKYDDTLKVLIEETDGGNREYDFRTTNRINVETFANIDTSLYRRWWWMLVVMLIVAGGFFMFVLITKIKKYSKLKRKQR